MAKSVSSPWIAELVIELLGEGEGVYEHTPKVVQVLAYNSITHSVTVSDLQHSIDVYLAGDAVEALANVGKQRLKYCLISLKDYNLSTTVFAAGNRPHPALRNYAKYPVALVCDELQYIGGHDLQQLGNPEDINVDLSLRKRFGELPFESIVHRLAKRQWGETYLPQSDGHFAGCDEPFSHDVWPLTAHNLLSNEALIIRYSETGCEQSKILHHFYVALENFKANNGKGGKKVLPATPAALDSTLPDDSRHMADSTSSTTVAATASKGKKKGKKGGSSAPTPQPQPHSTLGAESMSQVEFSFRQLAQVPETLLEGEEDGGEREDDKSEVGDMLNGQQIVMLPELLYSAMLQQTTNQTSTLVPDETLSESQSQNQSQLRVSQRNGATKIAQAAKLPDTLVESQPTPVVFSKTADTGSTPSDVSVGGTKRGRPRKTDSQVETHSPVVPNGQPTQPAIPTSIEVPSLATNRNKAAEEALVLSDLTQQTDAAQSIRATPTTSAPAATQTQSQILSQVHHHFDSAHHPSHSCTPEASLRSLTHALSSSQRERYYNHIHPQNDLPLTESMVESYVDPAYYKRKSDDVAIVVINDNSSQAINHVTLQSALPPPHQLPPRKEQISLPTNTPLTQPRTQKPTLAPPSSTAPHTDSSLSAPLFMPATPQQVTAEAIVGRKVTILNAKDFTSIRGIVRQYDPKEKVCIVEYENGKVCLNVTLSQLTHLYDDDKTRTGSADWTQPYPPPTWPISTVSVVMKPGDPRSVGNRTPDVAADTPVAGDGHDGKRSRASSNTDSVIGRRDASATSTVAFEQIRTPAQQSARSLSMTKGSKGVSLLQSKRTVLSQVAEEDEDDIEDEEDDEEMGQGRSITFVTKKRPLPSPARAEVEPTIDDASKRPRQGTQSGAHKLHRSPPVVEDDTVTGSSALKAISFTKASSVIDAVDLDLIATQPQYPDDISEDSEEQQEQPQKKTNGESNQRPDTSTTLQPQTHRKTTTTASVDTHQEPTMSSHVLVQRILAQQQQQPRKPRLSNGSTASLVADAVLQSLRYRREVAAILASDDDEADQETTAQTRSAAKSLISSSTVATATTAVKPAGATSTGLLNASAGEIALRALEERARQRRLLLQQQKKQQQQASGESSTSPIASSEPSVAKSTQSTQSPILQPQQSHSHQNEPTIPPIRSKTASAIAATSSGVVSTVVTTAPKVNVEDFAANLLKARALRATALANSHGEKPIVHHQHEANGSGSRLHDVVDVVTKASKRGDRQVDKTEASRKRRRDEATVSSEQEEKEEEKEDVVVIDEEEDEGVVQIETRRKKSRKDSATNDQLSSKASGNGRRGGSESLVTQPSSSTPSASVSSVDHHPKHAADSVGNSSSRSVRSGSQKNQAHSRQHQSARSTRESSQRSVHLSQSSTSSSSSASSIVRKPRHQQQAPQRNSIITYLHSTALLRKAPKRK